MLNTGSSSKEGEGRLLDNTFMSNIFKNLFSHRYGLLQNSSIIKIDSIDEDIINAIGSCYDILCQKLEVAKTEYPWERLIRQIDIERELWVHFENKRLSKFENNGYYYLVFNNQLDNKELPWNRLLDLVEYVCKWLSVNIEDCSYLDGLLKDFESNINKEFDRLDYGYRIVNHCIVDVISDIDVDTINDAISNSKDNVSNHLKSAIVHYSARPNPDVRNSIKESISAVEAVCRELTGDDTLGKALKHLENNGIVIHRVLKDAFSKFYVYTNDSDSGIRHALMDKEGIYVPSKDEAYYMLVSCSAFVNYLRRKVAP